MKANRPAGQASRSWPRPWVEGEQHPDDAPIAALLQQATRAEPQPPEGMQQRVLQALRSSGGGSFRRRLAWAWALLVLLGVSGAATWWLSREPAPPPFVTNVKVVHGWATLGGRKLDATYPPQDFCSGCQLSVAPQALSSAEIQGGGRMVFSSNSKVSLPSSRQSGDLLTLELREGRVLVQFDAGTGRSLVVRTRDAAVLVTGTIFSVETGSDAAVTRVDVYEGTVRVSCAGEQVRVGAPDSFACPGGPLGPAPPLGPPEAALVGLAPEPPRPAAAPPREQATHQALSQPPPEARESRAVAPAPGRKLPAAASPRPPEPAPAAVSLALRDATPPVPPVPARTWPQREAELLRLARSDGAQAADALFSLGALRYDLKGDLDGARRAWQEYLRRFPAGHLRGEVDLALFEVERSVGRYARALDHARKALEHIGDPDRARKLKLGMAEIYHVHQGAPDRALGLYREVAAGQDAVSERASYLLIDCLAKLDRPAEARAAIEAYLDRFPAGQFADLARRARDQVEEKK